VLASFFRRGWWLYLIIPGYYLWKIGLYFWAYLDQSQKPEAGEELDAKELKRLEKAKKREERPKMRVVTK